MFHQVPQLCHILRKKQHLLNQICHVANPSLLGIFDGGVKGKRGPIKYQRGAPSKDSWTLVSSSFRACTLSGTFFLLGPSDLGPFGQALIHLGLDLPFFKDLFSRPLDSLPFRFTRLSGRRSGQGGGRLRIYQDFKCGTLGVEFQQDQQVGNLLLDDHALWYIGNPLIYIDLCYGLESGIGLRVLGWVLLIEKLEILFKVNKKDGSCIATSSPSSKGIVSSLAWMRLAT